MISHDIKDYKLTDLVFIQKPYTWIFYSWASYLRSRGLWTPYGRLFKLKGYSYFIKFSSKVHIYKNMSIKLEAAENTS